MAESNQKVLDYKSYALFTFLARDIFGYLFVGIAFLIIVEILFSYISSLKVALDVGIGETLSIIFLLAISYPIGRLIFITGNFFTRLIPKNNFDYIYHIVFQELAEDLKINGKEIVIQGFVLNNDYQSLNKSIFTRFLNQIGFKTESTHKKGNVRTIFGRIGLRWIFNINPSIYFIHVARPNVLMMLSETLLGLVILIFPLISVKLYFTDFSKTAFIFLLIDTILVAILYYTVNKSRKERAYHQIATLLSFKTLYTVKDEEE